MRNIRPPAAPPPGTFPAPGGRDTCGRITVPRLVLQTCGRNDGKHGKARLDPISLMRSFFRFLRPGRSFRLFKLGAAVESGRTFQLAALCILYGCL